MTIESAKREACVAAVLNHVSSNTKVIGIGSGSTIVHVPALLKQKMDNNELNLKACIPTSFQARQLILEYGLPLGDLNQYPVIDVCIDGADEVDHQLQVIKGGGACHLQEKMVASCARSLIIVADESKDSVELGEKWKKGVPLEVMPLGYVAVMKQLENGEAKFKGVPTLRIAKNKAGPVISDNGNFIIDCDFGIIEDPVALAKHLDGITGIIEHGLFVNMAKAVYFGKSDSTVYSR